MAHNFGSLVFTPVAKALQERHGSRGQYARLKKAATSSDRLGRRESEFIAECDGFYLASVGETGWPRFTADQIQEALTPIETRMQKLEQDNERLREELARRGTEAETAERRQRTERGTT